MHLMIADGDAALLEANYGSLLFKKFKITSHEFAEKFNGFRIPTIVEMHHTVSKFDAFSSDKLVKNLNEKITLLH